MKPQPTAHREGIYGWYPPSHNIYTKPSYKQLTGYDKECLFKHWYSAYAGLPGAKAPPPPGLGYVEAKDKARSASQVSQRSGGQSRASQRRAATSHSIRSDRKASPTRIKYLTSSGSIRPGSRSVVLSPSKGAREAWHKEATFTTDKSFDFIRPQSPMSKIPHPDVTYYGFSYDTPVIPETPQVFLDSQPSDTPSVPIKPPLTPPSPPPKSPSPTRAKSATTRKSSSVASRRSIRSAGPFRPQMTPPATEISAIVPEQVDAVDLQEALPIPTPPQPPVKTPSVHDDAEIPKVLTPPSLPRSASPRTTTTPPKSQTTAESIARSASSARPATVEHAVMTPVPTPCAKSPSPSLSSQRHRIKSAPVGSQKSSRVSRPCAPTPSKCAQISKEDSDAGLTYDELLDKYGWRMQVHGDPLNIKKKCIADRLQFTVKCPVPKSLPDPPKVHIEIWDTFFSNTIPRKPLSYTIHPEFVSEVLHAKRMELQKREGLNYRYKDFAFVY